MNDSKPLHLHSLVVRSEQLIASQLGDELVMMDIDSGNYFSLDPIAADIWERLGKPVRIADLCDQLRGRYDVEEERCRREVLALLEQMQASAMVRLADE